MPPGGSYDTTDGFYTWTGRLPFDASLSMVDPDALDSRANDDFISGILFATAAAAAIAAAQEFPDAISGLRTDGDLAKAQDRGSAPHAPIYVEPEPVKPPENYGNDEGYRELAPSALDAGVPPREVQVAVRHADPRQRLVYDRRRQDFDRHAAYVVVVFVAGG